tara:strand:- start:629 stop:1609 length:981 start_codon:yes stop_codon:yes gene_type:complete
MKKKIENNIITEKKIIHNYLNKLNFNKIGTFNFKNDAAYIKTLKNKKIVITSDSISEKIDFFKFDNPKSIANKIITINLSDLSAMGAYPFTYSLNLFLPNYIDNKWLRIFTNELYKLQKKYNFYLLGGDISKSNELSISATFFGNTKTNKVIKNNSSGFNKDIWVTGNIGDSYIGLNILKKKININDKKIENYFINKYYFPKHSLIGSKITRFVDSMKDISDGLIGDLQKMLIKNGASLNMSKIPISKNLKKIIKNKKINFSNILNGGDDYELIIISKREFRKKIISIAKSNKVKITLIGKTIKKNDLFFDSNNDLNIPREFDHFS